MGNVKRLFQAISYLQYPLMLLALGHVIYPYFAGFDTFWTSINSALVFSGLAISFSTLQDTTKTQNNLSRKIWEDPRKGMLALMVIAGTTLLFLALGMFGFFISRGGILKEVSFGALMLGLGYVGLLKAAIEMHEHHRVVARAVHSAESAPAESA